MGAIPMPPMAMGATPTSVTLAALANQATIPIQERTVKVVEAAA